MSASPANSVAARPVVSAPALSMEARARLKSGLSVLFRDFEDHAAALLSDLQQHAVESLRKENAAVRRQGLQASDLKLEVCADDAKDAPTSNGNHHHKSAGKKLARSSSLGAPAGGTAASSAASVAVAVSVARPSPVPPLNLGPIKAAQEAKTKFAAFPFKRSGTDVSVGSSAFSSNTEGSSALLSSTGQASDLRGSFNQAEIRSLVEQIVVAPSSAELPPARTGSFNATTFRSSPLPITNSPLAPTLERSESDDDSDHVVPERRGSSSKLSKAMKSFSFEAGIALVIIVNCTLLGLEASYRISGDQAAAMIFQFSGVACMTVFVLEVLLRLWAAGRRAWAPTSLSGVWLLVDAFLVCVCGLTLGWIMPLSFRTSWKAQAGIGGPDGFASRSALVLRIVRLLGFARILKQRAKFREAWLLMCGLADSARALACSCAMLVLVTYMFAVVGVATISMPLEGRFRENLEADTQRWDIEGMGGGCGPVSNREELALILEHIGGVGSMMVALFGTIGMGSRLALHWRIFKYLRWSWLYFYAYAAVGILVVLNLVIAVLIEGTFLKAKIFDSGLAKERAHNRKAKLYRLLSSLSDMGESLAGTPGAEKDHTTGVGEALGQLSLSRLEESLVTPSTARQWRSLGLRPHEVREAFSALAQSESARGGPAHANDHDAVVDAFQFFSALDSYGACAKAHSSPRTLRRLGSGAAASIAGGGVASLGGSFACNASMSTNSRSVMPKQGSVTFAADTVPDCGVGESAPEATPLPEFAPKSLRPPMRLVDRSHRAQTKLTPPTTETRSLAQLPMSAAALPMRSLCVGFLRLLSSGEARKSQTLSLGRLPSTKHRNMLRLRLPRIQPKLNSLRPLKQWAQRPRPT